MRNTVIRLRWVTPWLLLSSLFLCQFSLAADFSWGTRDPKAPTLIIKGEIKQGDFRNLLAVIIDDAERGGEFLLSSRRIIVDSPGGSIDEAIQMGGLFRDMYAHVMVAGGNCSSACFFLFAGAASRSLFAGQIGLHNPYLSHTAARNMSAKELELALKAAELKSRQVLNDFGTPTYLIERMLSRTSVEAYQLSADDIYELGEYSNSWNQIRVSKCNADAEYERAIFRKTTLGPFPTSLELDGYARYRSVLKSCEDRIAGRDTAKAVLAYIQKTR